MKRRKPLKRSRFKTRLTPLKVLKRDAWQSFARYIRKRDPHCVTCLIDGKFVLTDHAGHYRHNSERNQSLGGNALWYDTININGQCVGCNTYKSGNLEPYARYLEHKHGTGILQVISKKYFTYKKWTREELETLILHYNEAVTQLHL